MFAFIKQQLVEAFITWTYMAKEKMVDAALRELGKQGSLLHSRCCLHLLVVIDQARCCLHLLSRCLVGRRGRWQCVRCAQKLLLLFLLFDKLSIALGQDNVGCLRATACRTIACIRQRLLCVEHRHSMVNRQLLQSDCVLRFLRVNRLPYLTNREVCVVLHLLHVDLPPQALELQLLVRKLQLLLPSPFLILQLSLPVSPLAQVEEHAHKHQSSRTARPSAQ